MKILLDITSDWRIQISEKSIRRKIWTVSTGEWHHWREETIESIHLLVIITYFSTDNLEVRHCRLKKRKFIKCNPSLLTRTCAATFSYLSWIQRSTAERSTPSRERFTPSNRRVKTSEHPHLIPCPLRLHPQLVWTPTEYLPEGIMIRNEENVQGKSSIHMLVFIIQDQCTTHVM